MRSNDKDYNFNIMRSDKDHDGLNIMIIEGSNSNTPYIDLH